MGNRKGRKSQKQSNTPKATPSVNVTFPENITSNEMQHIIAEAIVEAERIKEKDESEQQQERLRQWQIVIGYKEDSNKLRNILNRLRVFIKILFLPEDKIEGDRASSILLKMFVHLFFWIMKCGLAIIALFLFIYDFVQFFKSTDLIQKFQNIAYLPYSLFAFILSKLFRMASIEIDKIEDRNYLFSIFACTASIISIIIAIIAVVKGR